MKRRRSVWFGVFLTAAGLLLGSYAASPAMSAAALPSPSFDCAKPSEIEAVICGDPALSAADRRLASFYGVAKAGALGNGSNQLAVQRNWLKQRDRSCAKGAWRQTFKSLRACIAAQYDDRLEELAIATLMVSPKESLAELGRITPRAAPLYRAAHDYAAIDDSPRQSAMVEADLAPFYAAMDAGVRERSPGLTVRGAAATDKNFAEFFATYAALGMGDRTVTWPCAVLAKRPGLIDGLGSRFGGAIDAAVPSSDCEANLPPTPEVGALSDAAFAAQPPCEGTIRFSTGREFAKLQDAVRLHLAKVWAPKTRAGIAGGNAPLDPAERAWRRSHKAESDKAQAALEAYYARYFGVEPMAAKRDAWSATDALIGGAFAYCD